MKKLSQSKEVRFLHEEVGNARKQLEPSPSRVLVKDPTFVDIKRATSEIKNYHHSSSSTMEKVMFSCLLLLGLKEEEISVSLQHFSFVASL